MSKLKQNQSLRQSLSPQQVIQANILQLNVSYLEEKILDELENNLLLDQTESEEISLLDSKQSDEQVDFDEDPDEYEPSNIYDNNYLHNHDIPIREKVDFLDIDRPLHGDHNTMKKMVKTCEIVDKIELNLGILYEEEV